MYGRKVKWQVDKFMAFCNAKKVFWELHVHLNILSFSIVTVLIKNQKFSVNQFLKICKK